LGPGVELRRTTYDLSAAAARVEQSAYPLARDFAKRAILEPVPEASMLQRCTNISF